MSKLYGPQEFWCSVCDCALVNSENPETGKFYLVAGNQAHSVRDDYHMILFAVCRNCNPLDALKEINPADIHVRQQ